MTWWVWSILANFGIASIEYTNRTLGQSGAAFFTYVLPITLLPIIFTQYALFKSWSTAPTLMLAWVTFATGNMLLRLGTSWVAGEPPSLLTVAGVGLVLAGALAIKGGS